MRTSWRNILIVLAAAVSCLAGWTSAHGQDKAPAPNVAAKVDGVVVPLDEYNKELARLQRLAFRQGMPTAAQIESIKKAALNNLVNREVLFLAATKNGVKVDDKVVEEELQALKKRFPSDEQFQEALKRRNMTLKELAAVIKKDRVVQAYVNKEVRDKLKITDKDLQEYYDKNPQQFVMPPQVRASHILIKSLADATKEERDKARKRLEDIQAKIKAGGDFAELAKKFSEDASAAQGGDLGFFGKGKMVKPFEDAAFALEKGKVSDIVETQFGYHLIKATDRKDSEKVPLDTVKVKLAQYLQDQKMQAELNQHIQALRTKCKIEVFVDVK